MSKREHCPCCGAICNSNKLEREGCWNCNAEAERAEEQTEFEAFMAQDEEERWRAIWLAAGKPY